VNILFVCLGNICRSPTAEGVARHLAAMESPGLGLQFDSAGTADYHVGAAPDARSQRHALARGYDISALRARQLQPADFQRFDLLLAMDAENLAAIRAAAPREHSRKARMFLEFAPACRYGEVPDPYYGGPSGFEVVLDLAEQGVRGLLNALASQDPAVPSIRR
jgi:protein-tyrosine phosphatase